MACHLRRARTFRLLPAVAALIILLTILTDRALAQVAGANLDGVITDDSGAVLPGVTVTIRNQANGATLVVTTSVEGVYRAVALPPATYEISAELPGFGPLR